jgi:transposase
MEDANVKIGDVLSDVFGVSGQNILEALLQNRLDAEQIAGLVHRSVQAKIPRLIEAIEGHRMTEHHRFMIRQSLEHMQYIEAQVLALDKEIQRRLQPYQKQMELVCSIPGIGPSSAASILAEIGMDMSTEGPFPDCHHLASWATVCPGNDESGGKRKSGHMRRGNRWFRATITQTSWAATAKKNSSFQARFRRIKPRRGPQRAIMAIAHAQTIAIYWVLRTGMPYQECNPAI